MIDPFQLRLPPLHWPTQSREEKSEPSWFGRLCFGNSIHARFLCHPGRKIWCESDCATSGNDFGVSLAPSKPGLAPYYLLPSLSSLLGTESDAAEAFYSRSTLAKSKSAASVLSVNWKQLKSDSCACS